MTHLSLVLLILITLPVFGQEPQEKILTNHPADDRYGNYSPDGDQIIFESNREGNWDIFVMEGNGKHQTKLTSGNEDDRRPSWHPGGQKVVFESNRNGKFELYELHLNNLEVSKIEMPDLTGEPIFARYSPDGTSIAFSHKLSNQQSNLLLMDMNHHTVKPLTNYGLRSYYPQWSPDGSTILFFSRHETNNEDDEIYQINVDGTGEKRLTHWPKHNFCPSWSHDGSRIAYVTSMEDIRPEIYIMNADGTGEIRVTANEDGDTLPDWSTDDRKLLITGYRNGNFEICEISIPQRD